MDKHWIQEFNRSPAVQWTCLVRSVGFYPMPAPLEHQTDVVYIIRWYHAFISLPTATGLLYYTLNADEETILCDLHIYVMSSDQLLFLNGQFIVG